MTAATASSFGSHPAQRLTLRLHWRDQIRHRSLVGALLRRAQRAQVTGATVFQAHHGYGRSGRMHQTCLLADDLPVSVVIVDRPDRIAAYLHQVSDLLDDVLVSLVDVDVVDF